MRKELFLERVIAAGRKLPAEQGEVRPASTVQQLELNEAEVVRLVQTIGLPGTQFRPIGGNLWCAVATINPELAFSWLTERNCQNRDPAKAQYEAIEQDIRAGQWVLTHQGIAFDGTGNLLDGQHRLFAVLDSERSVPMMVTLNVSAEAAIVIDRHRSRRARDLLHFASHRMTAFDEAVIRRSILGLSGSTGSPTVPAIVAFLSIHRDRLEWASGLFKNRGRGIVIAPLVAGVFRASFHVNAPGRKRLGHFTEFVQEGVAKNDDEVGAVLLRDWLVSRGRATRKRAQGHESYGRVIRAINAFLLGEKIGKLYSASSDLYPLPQTVPTE